MRLDGPRKDSNSPGLNSGRPSCPMLDGHCISRRIIPAPLIGTAGLLEKSSKSRINTNRQIKTCDDTHAEQFRQILSRHAMSRYTRTFKEWECDAVNRLPDFSAPSRERQKAVATGTNGAEAEYKDPENDLASSLAFRDGFGGISADGDGQSEFQGTSNPACRKSPLIGKKGCFSPVDGGIIPPSARSSVRIERRFPKP